MIIRAVHSTILLQLELSFLHSDLDHSNYVIALARHENIVTESLVIKLNTKAIFLSVSVDSLDHWEVIWALAMVFVSVDQNVLDEVQL